MTCLVWHTLPALSELATIIRRHAPSAQRPLYLAACLQETRVPAFAPSQHTDALETALAQALQAQTRCVQFHTANALYHVLPNVHLWLLPPHQADRFADYLPQLIWQQNALPQSTRTPKPWLVPPAHQAAKSAVVVGAGIAGAATAYYLAEAGVRVQVLERGRAANAASGNRQGLLYAKISPHATVQTELLLAGYGHTRRLLARLLPESDAWGGQGVLHLNFNEAERKRNQALAAQSQYGHLYRGVSEQEAAELAGIPVFSDGLYWPQGVWLNPAALIHALLSHPNIELHEHTPLLSAEHDGTHWQVNTPQGRLKTEHIVYCCGADSHALPEPNIGALPFRHIRGQTGVAAANAFTQKLRCALSGESYISPSWHKQHGYGASFVLNNNDCTWQPHEEAANRTALHTLNPALAEALFSDGLNPIGQAQGHAAVRCDSFDHLPMVGAVGDAAAMQRVYAKLALDKNYRLTAPCPYLPNVWINTAHGTRGLATAPICAAALAAEILGLPNPLAPEICTALAPNRAVVRAIIRGET